MFQCALIKKKKSLKLEKSKLPENTADEPRGVCVRSERWLMWWLSARKQGKSVQQKQTNLSLSGGRSEREVKSVSSPDPWMREKLWTSDGVEFRSIFLSESWECGATFSFRQFFISCMEIARRNPFVTGLVQNWIKDLRKRKGRENTRHTRKWAKRTENKQEEG